ncbi:MAG TPA: class I SAM-dependent methyltransferase [Polyangia bacterium]|jgi:SAM-dependent methyltransferase
MSARDYVLPSSASEAARLEQQAALYGGTDFLRPFLAVRPREVLEVGCGTGCFCRHVGAQLPGRQVTGLDLDAGRIAYARARSATPNVRFEEGDLLHLPFDADRFDLVFCRFVLVHLADPTAALREMARVARPGGVVLAYDMVHDGIWFSPPKPAFARLLRAALDVMRERGMEPSQGLHLAPGMIRAGLAEVGVEVIPHHALAAEPRFEAYRRNWLDTVTGLAEILGAHFDAGLVEEARAELEQRGADELLVELTVLAHGRKGG